MGAPLSDEQLIDAILRLRVSQPGLTAAETHKALVDEGHAELELAAVKKAAGKATKRAAKEAAAAPPPPAQKAADAAPTSDAKVVAPAAQVSDAKAAKQAKMLARELKSAENDMMDAQRRLRAAKAGGDMAGMPVTINGTVEEFVQEVAKKAMAGILEPGEERFLKERIECDIAALEWIRISQKAGTLRLSEDIVALGGELQLQRLKEVRDCRGEDLPKALACYKKEGLVADGSYQDVDKTLSKAGALAATAGGDGELADID